MLNLSTGKKILSGFPLFFYEHGEERKIPNGLPSGSICSIRTYPIFPLQFSLEYSIYAHTF